jgi:hypothetical protein
MSVASTRLRLRLRLQLKNLPSREILELEAKPKSEDPEEAAEDESAVEARREELAKVKKDIVILEPFY